MTIISSQFILSEMHMLHIDLTCTYKELVWKWYTSAWTYHLPLPAQPLVPSGMQGNAASMLIAPEQSFSALNYWQEKVFSAFELQVFHLLSGSLRWIGRGYKAPGAQSSWLLSTAKDGECWSSCMVEACEASEPHEEENPCYREGQRWPFCCMSPSTSHCCLSYGLQGCLTSCMWDAASTIDGWARWRWVWLHWCSAIPRARTTVLLIRYFFSACPGEKSKHTYYG